MSLLKSQLQLQFSLLFCSSSIFFIKTMRQNIVIEVAGFTSESRSEAMSVAADFSGVESIELKIDEQPQKLVVTGDGVDSVKLTKLLRKKFGYADLVSVSVLSEVERVGDGNNDEDGGSENQSTAAPNYCNECLRDRHGNCRHRPSSVCCPIL